MPYAREMRKDESPAPADGFVLSDLWMLPMLLLVLMFQRFGRHLASLKQMRRSRAMPQDWRSFWPDLRRSEWGIRRLTFEGARQILLGGELDLTAIVFDPEPPDDFQPSMPRSALAMHQRIEDITRFYADPEHYIRRHAERIRQRATADDSDDSAFPIPATIPMPAIPPTIFRIPILDAPAAIAIRGPPWRASLPQIRANPTRSAVCENETPCSSPASTVFTVF
jgi:hypothetical protein